MLGFSKPDSLGVAMRGAVFAAFTPLLLGAVAMRSARADGIPICVANNTQLANALANAQFVPTTIKIVQGQYDLKNTVWHQGAFTTRIQAGSELLGGYSANCSARNIEVGNTVLGDTGSNVNDGVDILGDFTFEGLTWSAPYGLNLTADSGYEIAADSTILLRRDAFLGVNNQDYHSVRILWLQSEDVGGTIRVVDTLIAGNTHTYCSLDVEVDSGNPHVQLVNNTIVDNTGDTMGHGSGTCMFNHIVDVADGSGTLSAYNNIFHGNTGKDLYTDTHVFVPQLVDNMIGPHTTPGALELGTLASDPKLDADYRPIESPPSPVINSASATAPGGLPSTDLPGRARIVGTAPDRGAFESSIDDSFLQSVTNTNDSGAGSLRSAITGAVAHGSGLITFDIGSSCGPHVITLNTPLPAVTVPLIINGATQTGSTANDLDAGDDATYCVILESSGSGVPRGLQVPSSASGNAALTVNGIAFSGFSTAAIDFDGSGGHSVIGSRFGGTIGAHSLLPNGIGIRLGTGTHDVSIGGDDPAQRNVIGEASGSGIAIFGNAPTGSPPVFIGAHDNQIIRNMIGVSWSIGGEIFTDLGNGTRGIYVSGYSNTIRNNWIGDNAQAGVLLTGGGAQNNLVEENHIGFLWGAGNYGNGQAGIRLSGDVGDAPTANTIRYNVLSENGTQGVWVEIGGQNRIRRNGIYGNGGLGIDLVSAGILPNDNDGAVLTPDYANRGLNYPVLTAAGGNIATGTFVGMLNSTLGDYRIDFYETPSGCNPGDNRQGQGWIDSTTVTISIGQVGGQGSASFSVQKGPGDLGSIPAGAGITATATDSSGNTSEFSACVPYVIQDRIFANGFELPI